MSSSTLKFKAALPADFSGDPADSICWIKATRAYFAINSKLYSTDKIKVMTTLNKMSKGRGINFSEMWYDRMSNAAIDARGRKGNPSFFTSRNPPPHDLNAMDVDAISLTKLTPVERACCIREKLCFRCRKPGHSASQHNQSTPHPQNIRTTNTSKPIIRPFWN